MAAAMHWLHPGETGEPRDRLRPASETLPRKATRSQKGSMPLPMRLTCLPSNRRRF
jgi:hypothetical protein